MSAPEETAGSDADALLLLLLLLLLLPLLLLLLLFEERWCSSVQVAQR